MKRCLSVLLALIMVLMPTTAALAVEGEATLSLSIGTTTAKAGDTVELTIEITNNPGIYYLGIYFDYDAEALELKKVANLTSLSFMSGKQSIWYCNGNDNYTETGDLATLTFVVKDGAAGDLNVSVDMVWSECYDMDENDIAYDVTAGLVHVHDVVHVDAVAPGCHYNGNVEHWYCTSASCGTVWTDAELTQISNHKSVVIPELGGDVVHVEAVGATCNSEGNIEYWYCEECEQVWADEARTQLTNFKNVIVGSLEHNIVHVDAVAPGCHYEGNIEHWYCLACETVWSDEALTQITNHKSVIIPELGGNVIHVEAKAPTCNELGNIEYWYCEECMQVWADEARTQLTNMMSVKLGTTEHNIIHMEAVAPGCHYEGNTEHWYCTNCDTVWADEALTQITNHKNVIIPATGEGNLVHMDAVAPGCHMDGNIEYWICYDCEQVWADEALTQLTNIKNVVLPATGEGNLVHMEAVAPGCHYEGNIEYWICYECEQVWSDEALTQLTNIKNVVLPELGGEVVHVEAKDPTCNELGNIEYWYCEECEQVWQDEALTQLTNSKNVLIGTLDHTIVHMDAVEAGCHYTGNNEHWYCSVCNTVWADEALTQITNHMNVIIPATGEGNLVHMDAVAPGCHYEGNIEYWICYECEQVWQDEALTQLTNYKNVILPELGGEVVHVEAKDPTYKRDGNIEYWTCYECDQVWADEARTQLTNIKNVIIPMLVKENYVNGSEWTGDTEIGSGYIGDLTDGKIEPNGKYDTSLWYGADMRKDDDGIFTMIVDLGDLKEIGETRIHAWPAGHSGIVVPGSIDFYASEDGETYTLIGSVSEFDGNAPQWVGVSLEEALSARYVRIDMVGAAEGDTGVFWFASEIEVLEHVEHIHDLVHVDAVAPGCHYEGNIEHWYCLDCGTVWSDEALTQITNHMSVILPELGGEVVHVDAKAPSCDAEGNIEYWYCEECEQVWQDEARTQLTNFKNVLIGTLDHTIVHMDAVEAGCHYTGNNEHWYCSVCNTVWADEALTQITNHKNVIIPATGEGNLVHMDAVAPGCHMDGNIEYWICYDCEQVWQDEALTQLTNIKNVVLPATGGEVVHVEAKAPTATENGNIEYWYCEECELVWQDKELTQITNHKNVIIPAVGVAGDVDGNGVVNAKDYMMVKRYVLGTYNLTAEQLILADIDGNGEVKAKDYLMLKRMVLGTWSADAE